MALEVKSLLGDVGLRGWPKTSGSRGMHVNVRIEPRWTFYGGAARGAGAVAGGRAAGADAGDFEVVEGRAARRVSRLQPECEGPDDMLGVFGAAGSGCAGVGSAEWSEVAGLRIRRTLRCLTMPSGSRRSGDPHAEMDAAAGSLEKLLELADARRGGGTRRCSVAAALPQDGRRRDASGAVACEVCGEED